MQAIPNYQKIKDYLNICKYKVIGLMLLTAWVGMYMAGASSKNVDKIAYASLGIMLCAASGGIFNHFIDRNIDRYMARTSHRPLANNRISAKLAIALATVFLIVSSYILYSKINNITLFLTLFAMLGYALFYSVFLKHSTPQNIVLGGIFGAMPPLLGWSAISNSITPNALILVLIIYTWTPPHFWALAIYRLDDYKSANIPMLPVTHGVKYTKLFLLLYSLLLVAVTSLPYVFKISNIWYLIASAALNSYFLYLAIKLYFSETTQDKKISIRLFKYSIWYLLLLFIFLMGFADLYVIK